MAADNSILVLGAGELGMAVLRGLARQARQLPEAVRLTVMLRPSTIASQYPGKQHDLDELGSLGVQVLSGNLVEDSAEDLAEKFREFRTVIGCTGFVAGRGVQVKLTHAALSAGVNRYIPWQFGVDYDVIGRGSAQDLFDEQLDVRDLLRSQDRMEWVIISTGMFTSFLFEPSFGVVDFEQNVIRALGSWDNSVTVTTPDDIGVLTAATIFTVPRIINRVVYTAGDTLTYSRLADIVESVLKRNLTREVWSVDTLKEALARDPDNPLKKYRVVFAEGRGISWEADRTFNAQNGIGVLSVDQWLREKRQTNEIK